MLVRFSLACAIFLLPALPQVRGTSTQEPLNAELAKAWSDAALSLSKEAYLRFAGLPGDEARFGEALSLLQLQPKTDANIEKSAQLLKKIADSEPDSELGIAARYYLGRLEQAHRTPLNPQAAAKHYRILVNAHPHHPLGEQALVKLALIDLYNPAQGIDRLKIAEDYRARGRELQTPNAIRDLNLAIARAAERFHLSDELALACYMKAEKAGIRLSTTLSDTLIAIGELAGRTNKPAIAREYYQKFLDEFQRDNRRLTVREHMAALPASDNQSTSGNP